jgi:hypothetical protein
VAPSLAGPTCPDFAQNFKKTHNTGKNLNSDKLEPTEKAPEKKNNKNLANGNIVKSK